MGGEDDEEDEDGFHGWGDEEVGWGLGTSRQQNGIIDFESFETLQLDTWARYRIVIR